MKKLLSFICMIILSMSLVSCGFNDKPENVVNTFCESLKDFDMEKASTCFETEYTPINTSSIEQGYFEEKMFEYFKTHSKEIKYSIGKYEIKGNNATIPVTFTYTDASPIMSSALGDYISQAFALALSGANDSVTKDLLATIFIEKTETINTGISNATINFKCIKTENGWKIQSLTDEESNVLINIISCNIVKVLDSFDEENNNGSNNSETVENYTWYDIPMNQSVELATIKMSITDFKESNKLTGNKYTEDDIAQENTKFVILTVEIENITKSPMNFDNTITICDSQGRTFKNYFDAYQYFDETFFYTELAPNIKKVGHFVYQVPNDSEGFYLTVAKSGTNEAYRLHTQ